MTTQRDDGQLEDGVLVRVLVPVYVRVVGFDDDPELRATEMAWEQDVHSLISDAIEDTDFYGPDSTEVSLALDIGVPWATVIPDEAVVR